jgi:hypothetical protein
MFLGERSFAKWHEVLDHYEILPYKNPPQTSRRAARVFAQMREYMTAAKKSTSE